MRPKLPLDFGETLELALRDFEEYAGPQGERPGNADMAAWLSEPGDLTDCKVCLAGAPLRKLLLENPPSAEFLSRQPLRQSHPHDFVRAGLLALADEERMMALNDVRQWNLQIAIQLLVCYTPMRFNGNGTDSRIFDWHEVTRPQAEEAVNKWSNAWLDNLLKLRPGIESADRGTTGHRRIDTDKAPEYPWSKSRASARLQWEWLDAMHDVAEAWKMTAERDPAPRLTERIKRLYDGEQSYAYWVSQPLRLGFQFAPEPAEDTPVA